LNKRTIDRTKIIKLPSEKNKLLKFKAFSKAKYYHSVIYGDFESTNIKENYEPIEFTDEEKQTIMNFMKTDYFVYSPFIIYKLEKLGKLGKIKLPKEKVENLLKQSDEFKLKQVPNSYCLFCPDLYDEFSEIVFRVNRNEDYFPLMREFVVDLEKIYEQANKLKNRFLDKQKVDGISRRLAHFV